MKPLLLILLSFMSYCTIAQRVIYPENTFGERVRDIRYFQIVGKINTHFLIFENEKAHHYLRVYNDSMELQENTDLSFIPQNLEYARFINYPDFARLIYVYEKGNTFYCMTAKINENAKLISKPRLLFSTPERVGIDVFMDIVPSEDKSKILIYKDQRQLDQIQFTNWIYNDSMQLLHKAENVTYYKKHEEFFNNFSVNNEGDWIFTREKRPDQQSYPGSNIGSAQLCFQYHNEDTLRVNNLSIGGKLLDELVLKVDNENKHILVNSLYFSNSNIEGLYTASWNEKDSNWATTKVSELGNTIRTLANDHGRNAAALNNFYINHIILKKNGGFLVAAEEKVETYTTGLPSLPSGSTYFFLYDTYQKIGRQYLTGSPTHLYTSASGIDYGNILLLDVDSSGNLEWGNVVRKHQIGSLDVGWFSFATVFRGGDLNFIYNTPYKETWLLQNTSVTSTGKVIANPLMHSLRDKYLYMPSQGKQISENEFIIPAIYHSNLCFAKIVY